MPWHRSTADQLKDLLNLWYLSPGNSLGSGKDPITRVPSNYLHQMSQKMIIPSHCIRLMDCVGQGEVYVQVWGAPSSFNILSTSETHNKVEVCFLPITMDYCQSWYSPKAYLAMPTMNVNCKDQPYPKMHNNEVHKLKKTQQLIVVLYHVWTYSDNWAFCLLRSFLACFFLMFVVFSAIFASEHFSNNSFIAADSTCRWIWCGVPCLSEWLGRWIFSDCCSEDPERYVWQRLRCGGEGGGGRSKCQGRLIC